MTDNEYMIVGIGVLKVALIFFLIGVFVGWLIFKQ